ncbi:MAG TPA: glycosyltransferase, partial [Dermatophilaceae bacterium]|nr:glycosyltransferase [Dermatophilaceae bacterium]
MFAGLGDGTGRDTGPEVVPITGPGSGSGMSEPELSVVIACFNAESTLGLQLDALSGQLNPVRFEVILCDNGCTDGSVPLALSYRDRLDVRVVDAS